MCPMIPWLIVALGQPPESPVKLLQSFDRTGSRLVRETRQLFLPADSSSILLDGRVLGRNPMVVSLKDGKDVLELKSNRKSWNGMYLIEGGKTLVRFRDNLRPEIVPTTEFWDLATLKKTSDVELHLTHAAADGSIFGGPDFLTQRIRQADNANIYFYQKGKWSRPHLTIEPGDAPKGKGPRLVAISHDGGMAAVAEEGVITIWDLKEKKKQKTFDKLPGYFDNISLRYPIVEAKFTPDNKSLVVSGGDLQPTNEEFADERSDKIGVWLFHLDEGKPRQIARERYAFRTVREICFINETSFVAAELYEPRADHISRIVLYDLKQRKIVSLLDRKDSGNIRAFGASPDGKRIAIINGALELQVYELNLPKAKD